MANTSYRGSELLSQRALPDLVDEAEIAVRLGTSRRGMGRLRRRGVLPKPALLFKGHGVWLWETIQEWAGRPRRGVFEPGDAHFTVDLVAIGDIAARLEVEPRIVSNWYMTRTLPQPDYQWEIGTAWMWETIDRWQRGQGRAASPIVRRRREPVRVQSRQERSLVSAPIGASREKEDQEQSAQTLAEFDRLKQLFNDTSRQAKALVPKKRSIDSE